MNKISDKSKNNLLALAGFIVLIITAVAVVSYLTINRVDPSGNDIWSHLYKGDVVYNNLKNGIWYQKYSPFWYNGTQIFRYWAPLSYYTVAVLEYFSGGDIVGAYRLFAGVSIVLGGIPWIIWGRDIRRPVFATGLAVLWFFFPENLRVYFCEGNMPRMMSAIVIPYVMYFVWKYLREKKKCALLGVVLCTSLMLLSHVMITAMMGLATLVFLVFDLLKNKNYKDGIYVMLSMFAGLLLVGIWLAPALSGGIMSMESSSASDSVMKLWTGKITTLLNPMNRISGMTDTFYYGISFVLISIFGAFFAAKKRKAGFVLFLLILITSTTDFVPILSKLPMSTLFWMTRFATIIYGFFVFSLMEWKTLKKKYCIIVFAILLIDCLPSMNLPRYETESSEVLKEEVEEIKSVTDYRVALMDLSLFGSYPSWGLSTGDNKVYSTFGWAWQGATTSHNIVMLNTALEYDRYDYMFDRCVEMGNDAVAVRKDRIGMRGSTRADLEKSALKSGYRPVKETEHMIIFKKNVPKQFGVKSGYAGLAIGKYVDIMTMYYPAFEEGESKYIDDYRVEDLKKYKSVFVSGMLYHDREKAESIIRDAGEAGVRIVIDTTHMQEDSTTKQETFLGINNQEITIKRRFPALRYGDRYINAKDFSADYTEWFTGYVTHVDDSIGTVQLDNREVTWLGTKKNIPNVYFLGLNVMYHAIETRDTDVFEVMDEILDVDRTQMPERRIVPMKIENGLEEIVIHSDEGDVNTTIAYQDNFKSSGTFYSDKNLLHIKEKDIVLRITYPKRAFGILVSAVAFLMVVILTIMCIIVRGDNEN
ncbi:MAG: hypothetical protein K6G63_08740 [Eubacterium sp.]|nr:hypothetical protein [Eubacterium sp.]